MIDKKVITIFLSIVLFLSVECAVSLERASFAASQFGADDSGSESPSPELGSLTAPEFSAVGSGSESPSPELGSFTAPEFSAVGSGSESPSPELGSFTAPEFSALGSTSAWEVSPIIIINWISEAGAMAGNSQRVGVNFKVDLSTGSTVSHVCGLDNSSFKLETTPFVPTGAPAIMSAVSKSSSSCEYILNIAPVKDYQGTQYTWMPGSYTVILHYVKDGKELASKPINFTISDVAYTASMASSPTAMQDGLHEIGNTDQRTWLNPQPEPPLEPDGAMAKLTELKKIFDANLITQEEYDRTKAEILASMS